jgi:glutamate dehydrogenase (NAD(P)+)
VALQKITGPETSEMTGFVVVDLDGAATADGVVRCAKKILMDGARTMARSRTYSWALLGEQVSGASAAINVAPPRRTEGIAAFVDAVLPRVRDGELSLDTAKGLGPTDLASLQQVDTRSPLRDATEPHGRFADELTARSAALAAAAALDGIDGRTVAIEGAGTLGPTLLGVLTEMGARVVAIGTASGTLSDLGGLDPTSTAASWTEHGDSLPASAGSELSADEVLRTDADVLFCGSKLGLVDHEVAASLSVRVVAPIGVAPVTAKGLAVAGRGDVVVLADFLTLSGALHSFRPGEGATAESVREAATSRTSELAQQALAHPEGPYLGACAIAEEMLRSWRDELPFGRPLA